MQHASSVSALALALAATFTASGARADDPDVVHHEATVKIAPEAARLEVVDRITLSPALFALGEIEVELLASLAEAPTAEGAEVHAEAASAPLRNQDAGEGAVRIARLVVKPAAPTFTLRYGGVVAAEPVQEAGEHHRSFKTTSGIVDKEGVYLPQWLPEPRLAQGGRDVGVRHTFVVRIEGLPSGWESVAPGVQSRDGATVVWTSENPFAEMPLVAGPLRRTSRKIGDVEAVTLLREDDPALSARYLDVTAQYLALFEELVGPYPYRSFALVENFWETGYGMPGYTLLGSKVIRFPFILHSSYPHELLHNWWGNGVFLSSSGSGNWCEGLTAYLADHLVAEQRGQGGEYRRSLLVRYRDFVGPEDDFPLRQFRGRNSPATEAVGYGKWSMTLHMLRRELGDDAFRQVLRDFYARHKFRRAGFEDFQKAAELVAGRSLDAFFSTWLDRTGAPNIRWSDAQAYRSPAGQWSVSVTLEQTQAAATFAMKVPVAITLEDGQVATGDVVFDKKKTATAQIAVPGRPMRLDVDPSYDVFRVLHRGEVAPSLSFALGDEKALFVLPGWASPEEQSAWRTFAEKLCPPSGCSISVDKEVKELPTDASVWVLGYGNLLRAGGFVGAKQLGAKLDDTFFTLPDDEGSARIDNAKHSVALALSSPKSAEHALMLVASDNVDAVAGLARKLPHYGKYGYLAFAGNEPENVAKGQWAPVGSPMTLKLHPRAPKAPKNGPDLAARAPLGELPPPFDGARIKALVTELAAPAMAGRGYGTPELEKAAAVIEARFQEAGLAPFDVDGPGPAAPSYRHCFDDPAGPKGPTKACNVVGVIAGRSRDMPIVVLGAHYDHLGKGWPEAGLRSEHRGKVHPGANDNASGVAVLVDVARAMSSAGPAERTVLFAAFTGEEAGLRGSRALVGALGGDAVKDRVHSAMVLDTIGVRTDPSFLVLGQESAKEWIHVFHGVGFVTGVKLARGAPDLTASDHGAFLEKGVPAVQLFAGPHPSIHTPNDTIVDVKEKDLVDAALVTRETVVYLADRKEPLTAAGASGSATANLGNPGRSVQTGAVPDFKFPGPGVRLGSVIEGSPLGTAGLKPGDVLVEIDGQKLRDLRHYSNILRNKKPGDRLGVKAQRGAESVAVEIVLVAR